MMNAGAHFGHQTRRWNPKMSPFIYGARSGIHIIDLQQTYHLAQEAFKAAIDIIGNGGDILFIGTKPQARGIVEEEAGRAQMPFVKKRWLGGMLTNFVTIKKSVDRLIDFETRRTKEDGFKGYTKKELLGIDREIEKLKSTLGGIKNMITVPDAIFIVDSTIERIAIHEAKLLGIPVFALVDSNADPDLIDYPIPTNDDALASIHYFVSKFADACLIGLEKRQELALVAEKENAAKAKEDHSKKARIRKVEKGESQDKGYVAKQSKANEEEAKAEVESENVKSFSASPDADSSTKTQESDS